MANCCFAFEGDRVKNGDQLTEGPVVPHQIPDILGPQMLQEHLVNKVQEVYRLQGVEINGEHIEIIIRQMLSKVNITDPGDTELLWGDQVERIAFEEANGKSSSRAASPPKPSPSSPASPKPPSKPNPQVPSLLENPLRIHYGAASDLHHATRISFSPMPTLTLKNVPVHLHRSLKLQALAHKRSLNQEAIFCLENAVSSTGRGSSLSAPPPPVSVGAILEPWTTRAEMLGDFLDRPS